MKLTNDASVPVYTVAGASTARPLPEWLARKRKRSLKKDPEYANRVELLQDFDFEEASSCVRVSEDGDWAVSTGTYKPQMHVHNLPQLALSYARHTNALNQKFLLLSSDYSKSLHLQTDRFLEFHTPSGLHYTTRIPRYGRDLLYDRKSTEALVPSVGVNTDGFGEVFRLNLEIGRFMKGFEIDVGGDDLASVGAGALQGGIGAGAVNCAAVADASHGLFAFGTSVGTVEFWDPRSRNRVSALGPAASILDSGHAQSPEVTAAEFHVSGLQLAAGDSNGIITTYDLRSPAPLLQKDQGYGLAITSLKYLTFSAQSSHVSTEKLLSSDKRGIKIWDSSSGDFWTSIEPAVELNHVEWIPNSGMILTANEGRQQHVFFIPQLGPAPRWCGFLDNIVEEMAEDGDDPNAFTSTRPTAGDVYANYKFLDMKQLRDLSLDHLIGQTNLLRPYMHGYFVAQKLYEQARLLANPDLVEQQRQKSIQSKIDKERESRIRGNKKVAVKVNRRLAEKIAAREEANERRKAQRVLRQGGDEHRQVEQNEEGAISEPKKSAADLMADDRFKRLFEDEEFEIDETSREFQMHNPSSTIPSARNGAERERRLTAAEEEDIADSKHSDSDDGSEEGGRDGEADVLSSSQNQSQTRFTDEAFDSKRIGSSSYQKTGHRSQGDRRSKEPNMVMSSSKDDARRQKQRQNRSFGDLSTSRSHREREGRNGAKGGGVVGEKAVSFTPSRHQKGRQQYSSHGQQGSAAAGRSKERRSASGNTFRKM